MDKETLKMFSELLDSKLGDLENKLDSKLVALGNRLDSTLDRNTILLENLTSKVEIMAEIQNSHMDQDEKVHKDIVKNTSEKIDVVELAIKDTSKDVKEIKNSLTNVEIITSSNWNEIAKLKTVK